MIKIFENEQIGLSAQHFNHRMMLEMRQSPGHKKEGDIFGQAKSRKGDCMTEMQQNLKI